jgi:hypothetical protein
MTLEPVLREPRMVHLSPPAKCLLPGFLDTFSRIFLDNFV